MLDFKIVDAKEKDIEILTSMKMVTMIDDDMDKKLSHKEKDKIKNNIIANINTTYEDYKMIYVDKVCAGAYTTISYLDGEMIDQIYLFKEYRNKGIGTKIINKLKKKVKNLYVWVYVNNKDAIRLFRNLGFITASDGGRTVILKYDSINSGVMQEMEHIKIGYVDKNGKRYLNPTRWFRDEYYLQSAKEVLESGIGLCFDQVELERELISKMGVPLRTYYVSYPDKDYAHTFLVYKDNDKYYWFEHAWIKYRGIHEYDTKDELLLDVLNKYINTIPGGDYSKLKLYQYEKPRHGINYSKFLDNVINNKCIIIK